MPPSGATDPAEGGDVFDEPEGTELVVPASTDAPTTTAPPTTDPPTPTTTVPPTTLAPPDLPERILADPSFGATSAAFERLARDNPGASLSVVRGGDVVFSRGSGTTIDGQPGER